MELKNSIKRIEKEFDENVNSHVFLVETNNYDRCLTEIKALVKKITRTTSEAISNQIDEESYLELIVIRPDGKDIKKDHIFELQNRLKTKPILSDYLIYIMIGADSMNDTAANKLLKTIEEPNDHIIGFLLTSNLDLILPTIKSRCEIIDALYEGQIELEVENKEINEIADKLVEFIEKDDLLEYNIFKMDNKSIKENGKLVANKIKDYYNTACEITSNRVVRDDIKNIIQKNNTYNVLLKKALYMNKTLNKLTLNMNTDLLLEKIFIELKEVRQDESSRNKI